MNILVRDISDALAERIKAAALAQEQSQQEMLLDLLTATYAAPPVVVGWVKFDRPGELDGADCPECGQPLAEVWAGLLSNGQWIAPRCQWCAVSK